MRVCLVSQGDPTRNPNARALVHTLGAAGHEIVFIAAGSGGASLPGGVVVEWVPGRYPQRWGPLGALLRRAQPTALRRRLLQRALARAVAATHADIVYPLERRDLPVARRAAAPGTAVATRPGWPRAGARDILNVGDEAGRTMLSRHRRQPVPADHPPRGRHRNVRIAVAYRRTVTSPGRYLEAALRRAGADVVTVEKTIDWDLLDDGLTALVIVESPYPAMEVHGTNPGVPVLFWVHHGEHHLDANLRLASRYRADAVLLAHSWHLAHRFAVPVHRFPFAVAPELLDASKPFADRRCDVAMVGAGVEDAVSRYVRRHDMLTRLRAAYPDTTAFLHGVPPERLAAVYGDTRIVLNEVGTRHHPITMRVFEAVGSGALLLTDDVPGTDRLLRPETYRVLHDDVVAQVTSLLADPASADSAAAAHAAAMSRHTYDHRVDEMMAIIATTAAGTAPPHTRPHSSIGVVIDGDVEVQQIAQFGLSRLAAELPGRAVWDGAAIVDRLFPGRWEAVAIGAPTRYLERAVVAAKRYVYATGGMAGTVAQLVAAHHPAATVDMTGEVLRADLMLAEGYRLLPGSFQLAT